MKTIRLLILSAILCLCIPPAKADPVPVTIDLQFSFPDQAHADAAVSLLAAAYGYQGTINGAQNPESMLAFCKRMIGEQLARTVKNQAAINASNAAAAAAAAQLTGVSVQ